jgi:hypothetical protein
MTFHIIIRDGKGSSFKGKTLTEFQDNLVKAGYPPEVGEAERDKLRFFEKKNKRRARKSELNKIADL